MRNFDIFLKRTFKQIKKRKKKHSNKLMNKNIAKRMAIVENPVTSLVNSPIFLHSLANSYLAN